MVARKSTSLSGRYFPKYYNRMVAKKSTTQGKFKKIDTDLKESPSKLPQLCTVNCPGMENEAPSLQCKMCMCLFHTRCVNVYDVPENFRCLRCKREDDLSDDVSDDDKIDEEPPSSPIEEAAMFDPETIGAEISSVLENMKKEPDEQTGKEQKSATNQNQSREGSPKQVHVFRVTPKGLETSTANSSTIQSMLQANGAFKFQPVGPPPGIRGNMLPIPLVGSGIHLRQPLVNQPPPFSLSIPKVVSNIPLNGQPPSMNNQPPPPRLLHAPGLITTVKQSEGLSNAAVSSLSGVLSPPPPPLLRSPTASPATPQTPITSNTPSSLASGNFQNVKDGQLLTLPAAVIKRLNLNQPLSLKIQNSTVTIPPSCFFQTGEGLKVFVPAATFPVTSPAKDTSKPPSTPGSSDGSCTCGSSNADKSLKTDILKKVRKRKEGIDPSVCYFKTVYGGYDTLWKIFEYLDTIDLIRAGKVCKTWRKIVNHPLLWRTVNLHNTKITDWSRAIEFFEESGTYKLCLKGLNHQGDSNKTWHRLLSAITEFKGLREVTFGLVPVSVLHTVCERCPQLHVLNAQFIGNPHDPSTSPSSTRIDIGKFCLLKGLRELRLRGIANLTIPEFSFIGGMSDISLLKNIQHLSLTSLKSVPATEFKFLKDLIHLRDLEIGECVNWTSETYSFLSHLKELVHLKLECGGSLFDMGLKDALSELDNLQKLELIKYCMADTLETPLSNMEKLKHFVVWPDTTKSQAAQNNSNTLQVVHKLLHLQSLDWGVISLRKPDLLIGSSPNKDKQYEDKIDTMPFMLPEHPESGDDSAIAEQRISLEKLSDVLKKYLPDTEIKVFRAM